MTIDADAQDASPVTLAAARAEFDADVTYLDTATFGLPPWRSWAALQHARYPPFGAIAGVRRSPLPGACRTGRSGRRLQSAARAHSCRTADGRSGDGAGYRPSP